MMDGKPINELLKGKPIEIIFPGTPLKEKYHRKLGDMNQYLYLMMLKRFMKQLALQPITML